jgi:serine/threonine protein kinase
LQHFEIMEERYEIRGKIGQGGLGAVYKGYDTRMNREVAIKRISVSNEDPALLEESTRQLIKEAGALASLQHPHIVTVYDVGSDDEGPYVVMELISGKTLDELIERAPLTWGDFRELALQTQEALIAAQELDLIHSDIKPSNLMLTWLPSGKFQLKIVDFGLATLTQSQTKEELEELEAVFGSIFFMAPEQFERVPLDARADLYAMGCVYYQALTGTYPFKGETGNEVMVSHLHHKVIPIQEVRSDIPIWACDWIMWQINRMPSDRPASARESLQVFLKNDKIPNPPLSTGKPAQVNPSPPKARLANQKPEKTSPSPTRRVIDPRLAPPGYVPPAEPEPVPDPPLPTSAPQPLLPPEGSKPSIHTVPPVVLATPTALVVPTVAIHPTGRVNTKPGIRTVQTRKPAISGIKIAISACMGIIAALAGYMLYQRIQASKGSQRYNDIAALAASSAVTEIPMTGPEFAHVIELATTADTDVKRDNTMKALGLASPSDGADFDATIINFATTTDQFLPEDRAMFIRKVIGKRMKETMVVPMLDFARATNDSGSAVAAIESIRSAAGNEQVEDLLGVMQFHPNKDVRRTAAETVVAIKERSKKPSAVIEKIKNSIKDISDPLVREMLTKMTSEK